jgi:WD40 repeat protein/transcriptional regulator with XRE-family HTH domain
VDEGLADSAQPLHVRLNAARARQGISIREAAAQIGVPAPTVQGWLNGRHLPTPALRPQFQRLVELLGLTDQLDASWARRERSARLRTQRAPYLGLRPFSAADASLFRGRRGDVQSLVRRLSPLRNGLVAVVGASGSGKSSLLAAGLIGGACAPGGELVGWTAVMRPATEIAAGDSDRMGRADPRLVVADQFEDVLRLSPADRTTAIEALAAAARDRVVVISLRSDAFGEAMAYPALGPALSEPFLLGPPEPDELRAAVVAPAAETGVTVDDSLTELIVRDLALAAPGGQLAPLPLLSNALLATWAVSDGTRMTVADYLRVGGIASGIEQTAEETYADLSPEDQDRVKGLFLRLVRVEADSVHRESIPTTDLTDAERTDLDGFIAARMLTSDADRIVISHDALLSHWPRLRDWIEEGRQQLQAVARLRRATQLWLESERDPATLIPVQRLPMFAHLAADDPQLFLSPAEREFLAASRIHFANQLEAERRTSARLRQRGRAAITLAVAAVALAIVAGLMFSRSQQSAALAQEAERQAESRQVASQADQVREHDPAMSAQLGLIASSLAPTREGTSALLDATARRSPTRWLSTGPAVLAASDRRTLVVRGDGDGTLTVWRRDELVSSPGMTMRVGPAKTPLATVAVTDAGPRSLVAAGGVGVMQLLDVTEQPQLAASLPGESGTEWSATAFSPDGRLLAVGDQDGRILIYGLADPRAPTLVATLQQPKATEDERVPVSALLFGPDGGILYSAGKQAQILRWRIGTTPAAMPPINFSGDRPAIALATSPRGDLLAAGLYGRRVLEWHIDGERATAGPILTGFLGEVPGVAYSEDGKSLFAASEDHTLYQFAADTGTLQHTLAGPTPLTGVAQVGGRIVTTNSGGELRVWPVHDPLIRPSGSTGYSFATDRSSRWLALSTAFDGIALWDQTRDYKAMPTPSVDLGEPVNGQAPTLASGVGLDPDGRFLLAGTSDGRVVTWPLDDSGAGKPTIATAIPDQYIGSLAVSGDRRLVAAVGMNNGTATVLLRADERGQLSRAARLSTEDPYSASFSADSQLLAIPVAGNAVQIWSVTDPDRPALASTISGLPSRPMIATFAPTSRRLAIGMENGEMWVWDLTEASTPRPAIERGDAHGEIYGLNWSPDEQTIIAAGGDEKVWAWPTQGDGTTTILALTGDLGRTHDAVYTNHGTQIAGTGANGHVRIWTATADAAASQVCASRGDPLSTQEWARFLPGIQPVTPC